jgi:hypothetical protein
LVATGRKAHLVHGMTHRCAAAGSTVDEAKRRAQQAGTKEKVRKYERMLATNSGLSNAGILQRVDRVGGGSE